MCSMTAFVRLKSDIGGDVTSRFFTYHRGKSNIIFRYVGEQGVKNDQNQSYVMFGWPLMFSLVVCRNVDMEYQELLLTFKDL